MTRKTLQKTPQAKRPERPDHSGSDLELSRRAFVQALGAGLLITVTEGISHGQRRGSRGGSRGARNVAARLQIHPDGTITVMTGKVEEGQGARTQITQAAAEELHVGAAKITLVMADTARVPDDGMTAGSRTTSSTVPSVRRGAAAARQLLTDLAARRFNVDAGALQVQDGTITHQPTGRTVRYADLAKSPETAEAFRQDLPSEVTVTPTSQWDVLGTSVARPNLRDLVTGTHRYPSDIARPGMLYGKVLRPPSYGATLESIDLSAADAMQDVVVVREGEFIAFAAPTAFRAGALLLTYPPRALRRPSGRGALARGASGAGPRSCPLPFTRRAPHLADRGRHAWFPLSLDPRAG